MNSKNIFSFMLSFKLKIRFSAVLLLLSFLILPISTKKALADCPVTYSLTPPSRYHTSTIVPGGWQDAYCNLPAPVPVSQINWEQFHSWSKREQRAYARRVADLCWQEAREAGKSIRESSRAEKECRDEVHEQGKHNIQALDGCEKPRELLHFFLAECTACKVFGNVFNLLSMMSKRVFDATAGSAAGLIGAGLLVWLAIHVLKNVSSVAPIEPGDFLKTTLNQIFTAGLAAVALKGGTDVYGYLLEPVISGGMNFAAVAIQGAGGSSVSCNPQSSYLGGAFTKEMHRSLLCLMGQIHASVSEFRSLGVTLMCIARNAASSKWGIPDIGMWFTGAAVWVIAIIILLATPFYLFDALVRLGIVGAFLPLFIAAWAFKITRAFTVKGFNMLLNGVMSFIATTIVIAIDILLVTGVFAQDQSKMDAVINSGTVAEMNEFFDFSGSRFLLLLAMGYFAVKLLGKAGEVAGHFANANFSGAAPEVGAKGYALGKSAVQNAPSAAISAGRGLATSGKALYQGGKMAGKGIRNLFKSGKGGGNDAPTPSSGIPASTNNKNSPAPNNNNTPAANPKGNNTPDNTSKKGGKLGSPTDGKLDKNGRTLPPRDPKTGRFMKKQPEQTQSKKTPHWQTQARDEKGRFTKTTQTENNIKTGGKEENASTNAQTQNIDNNYTTQNNNDGSVTTSSYDQKTGNKTSTTTYKDGSKVQTLENSSNGVEYKETTNINAQGEVTRKETNRFSSAEGNWSREKEVVDGKGKGTYEVEFSKNNGKGGAHTLMTGDVIKTNDGRTQMGNIKEFVKDAKGNWKEDKN